MTTPSQATPAVHSRQTPCRLPRFSRPLALIAAGLLSGCEKPVPPPPPPPVVQALEIKESDLPRTATIIGQLDSPKNVEIRARVEAFVKKICFTEGTNVKEGDLLFELNEAPFIEKKIAAEAKKAETEAALRKAQADLARIEPLKNTGAVSKMDLDKAVAAVDTGTAAVSAANAQVESAKLDLGYCKVMSPIAGLIGAKEVSEGDLVGKGEPTLLATLSSLNPIWSYCNISEMDYLKIMGQARELGLEIDKIPLTLIKSNGVEHPEKGKLVFFDRAVSAKTGTMRLRAEFPNPTELLRPGMFGRVRFEGGTRKGIQVPQRAIVELQGKAFVWILNEDQTVNQRAVKLGNLNESNVAVLDGLKPGDRIIAEGIHKVREGGKVNAQAASPADGAAAATQPKQP